MNIKIEIECDTWLNVFQHLFVIRKDLKRQLKIKGIKSVDDLMNNCAENKMALEDDNCYGSHTVKIKP